MLQIYHISSHLYQLKYIPKNSSILEETSIHLRYEIY